MEKSAGRCRFSGIVSDRSVRVPIIKGKNPRKPYTVRYRDAAGRQREVSFTTRKEAEKFSRDQARAKEYGADVNPKAGRGIFTGAVESWIAAYPWRNERTKATYVSAYRKWVRPAYEGRTVREAALRADIARELVNVSMAHLCRAGRGRVLALIVRTLDSLVSEGVIESHRVSGVRLSEPPVTEEDHAGDGFTFLSDGQVAALAERIGVSVWLQRCMGLRICEALGVEKRDFIMEGRVLRLKWQASRDGRTRVPLKKRKAGQFRDVPVPDSVWRMVRDMPDGPLCPGVSTRYMPYETARERFAVSCRALGIDGVTTHSLRHQFASECLEAGMNIVDLAAVLGHSDPGVTLRTYVHAMPGAQERIRDMMNSRWGGPLPAAA